MRWKNGRATSWDDVAADHLIDEEGAIVAEVRAPIIVGAFPLYHYQCHQPGCGDNLSSGDRSRLKRLARKHQTEAHA